jgi:hypothetical protein
MPIHVTPKKIKLHRSANISTNFGFRFTSFKREPPHRGASAEPTHRGASTDAPLGANMARFMTPPRRSLPPINLAIRRSRRTRSTQPVGASSIIPLVTSGTLPARQVTQPSRRNPHRWPSLVQCSNVGSAVAADCRRIIDRIDKRKTSN